MLSYRAAVFTTEAGNARWNSGKLNFTDFLRGTNDGPWSQRRIFARRQILPSALILTRAELQTLACIGFHSFSAHGVASASVF